MKGIFFVLIVGSGFDALLNADELTVVSVEPPRHELRASRSAAIVVHFDRPVLRTSVTPSTFHAFGRSSGVVIGTHSFSDGDKMVRLVPQNSFAAGEEVLVVLSHDLEAADGSSLRQSGYAYMFTTRTEPASMEFSPLQTINVRTGSATRIYGGQACDFDGDRFVDLALVNEDSADVRVVLNQADGSGRMGGVLEPPASVGACASPNRSADFNGDGLVDLATANCTNSVSVLLGNGDGTFEPQQMISVSRTPHGLAALDVDGDGDFDLCTSNSGSGDIALMINDGSGVFGQPSFFDGGGTVEYGLDAADMNNDGVFDLVVGDQDGQEIIIHLGNGDGTFQLHSRKESGGEIWMVVCGDVNNDGNMDVSTANVSGTGSILLGDGAGNVAEPQVTPASFTTYATDLGDLDGDGDLDWVLTSFGGRVWQVFKNDSGVFTFDQEFFATANPGCCLMLDIDNDRDLDLALIDEIADEVRIMQNGGITDVLSFSRGDCNQDSGFDVSDAVATLLHLFDGGLGIDCGLACDSNGDARLDISDATYSLDSLFSSGAPPPAPFPGCGEASDPGALGCLAFQPCP